jgi:hypothetical protein
MKPCDGPRILDMSDDLIVVHGYITLGRIQIQVAEQLGGDVYREATIDRVSGEDSAQIVGPKYQWPPVNIAEACVDSRTIQQTDDALPSKGDVIAILPSLEQERHRGGQDLLVRIPTLRHWNPGGVTANTGDDLSQGVRQLWANRGDALAIQLRWRDLEQQDYLAVWRPVLTNRQMRQLQQFFASESSKPEHFDHRPAPESVVFFLATIQRAVRLQGWPFAGDVAGEPAEEVIRSCYPARLASALGDEPYALVTPIDVLPGHRKQLSGPCAARHELAHNRSVTVATQGAESASNCSSGMARGIRCCCFWRYVPRGPGHHGSSGLRRWLRRSPRRPSTGTGLTAGPRPRRR